jgi:hypothetical protein
VRRTKRRNFPTIETHAYTPASSGEKIFLAMITSAFIRKEKHILLTINWRSEYLLV